MTRGTVLDWAPGIILSASAIITLTHDQPTIALIIGMCAGFCLGLASGSRIAR